MPLYSHYKGVFNVVFNMMYPSQSHVVLQDSATQQDYQLGVENAVLNLTEVGTAEQAQTDAQTE